MARSSRTGPTARSSWLGAVSLLALLASGCSKTFDDIIGVDPADRVSESALFDDPNQAGLLASSAQAQFECSYGSYSFALALLGGEINSLGATTMFSLDARRPDKSGGFDGVYAIGDCALNIGVYVPLSSSRWFADKVLSAITAWTDAQVPGRTLLLAKTGVYAAYSYLLLGEGFCSMAIDAGPEITPAEVFALAEAKFSEAITAAQNAGGTADEFLNTALVGRARTRLNLNNLQGALTDAQAVPPAFQKAATRAAGNPLRVNSFYSLVNANIAAGLAPDYFDVRFNGKKDPRVIADSAGLTTTNVLWYTQGKYPAADSPIPLATGAEAQLIIAEVQGGQTAVDIINALHDRYGLDHYTPANVNDATEIKNQIIEERRRQFFLEGHRNYDRIRYALPLDPPPGSSYRWGGLFGDAKCLPLPDIETLNNPNTH